MCSHCSQAGKALASPLISLISYLLRAYSRAKLELQRSLGKGFEKIDSLGFCREIEFCPLSRNGNLSFTEIEAVENNLLIFVL